MNKTLPAIPAIPAKRYFTIGEVSELCAVKPYVLRYWEQEFTQLKPMKRRGNRRYYQHHEVLLIRRIRDLLYDQGFTISGARNRLADGSVAAQLAGLSDADQAGYGDGDGIGDVQAEPALEGDEFCTGQSMLVGAQIEPAMLRAELLSIRDLLSA